MTSSRKIALTVGVLFILTFITSIGAVLLYGPVMDPSYITGPGPDTHVFVGAFFDLMLILTNIGCAIVLFPLLKRQNEGLALGYVTARLVECTFILVGILALLVVVSLRQPGAVGPEATSLTVVDQALVAIKNWTFLLGPGFTDGIGTGLILGWLMYRSGIVSRRMAIFGVIGGPLLAISGAAVLLGVIPQGSSVQGLMTVPEIIWEAYLGLWLTVVGFNSARAVALAKRESPIASAYAAA